MEVTAGLDPQSERNLSRLVARLQTSGVHFTAARATRVPAALRGVQHAVTAIVRDQEPERTGNLKRRTRARVEGQASGETILSVAAEGVAYAPFVIRGTGVYAGRQPYTILPRAKKALSWPGARHPVRSVTIQGTHPNPFPERSRPLVLAVVRVAARDAARQIAGDMLGGES